MHRTVIEYLLLPFRKLEWLWFEFCGQSTLLRTVVMCSVTETCCLRYLVNSFYRSKKRKMLKSKVPSLWEIGTICYKLPPCHHVIWFDLFRNFDQSYCPLLRMKVLVLHKNSGIEIRGETLQCLKPCAWLNDDVVIPFSNLAYVFLISFCCIDICCFNLFFFIGH